MEKFSAKKDFSDIYNQDSPIPYLKGMRNVEYRISDITKFFYEYFGNKLHKHLNKPIQILDVGSSYGINSSLLIYDLEMSDLDDFFLNDDKVPSKEDAIQFFTSLPKQNPHFKFYLNDISSQALKFTKDMGLSTQTFDVNLEEDELSSATSAILRDMDMVIATGCVGYIGYKSFVKLLGVFKNQTNYVEHRDGSDISSDSVPKPLFVFSVLRIYSILEIQKVFEDYGFMLLKSEVPPFRQRRFYDEQEKMKTISLLNERGIVTTNFEDKGFYYTNLYVGAPKEHKNALISWVRSMEDDYLEKSSSESK
tara:strand:- start:1370 stop:2293 length:924 start_codon:yes stop_codon:yes gene_type:complete